MRTLCLSLLLSLCLSSAFCLPLAGRWTQGDDDILYITFHGGDSGVNTVLAYTAAGEELGQVLTDGASTGLRELRGMTLLPNGNLLVANAWKLHSRIIEFSGCNNGAGREFVRTLVSPTDVMVHPYGLALDPSSSPPPLFVSSQDGDTAVSYFSSDSGAGLSPQSKSASKDAGAWLDMSSDGSTRGIGVFRGQYLLLARQGKDDVHVYRIADQEQMGKIEVSNPIGVAVDQEDGIIYVSSNDKDAPGVRAFSLNAMLEKESRNNNNNTLATSSSFSSLPANTTSSTSLSDSPFPLLGSITLTSFSHPCGLALSPSRATLYVLVQNDPALLQMPTRVLRGEAPPSVQDVKTLALMTTEPEQVIVSDCFR